jgi:hypothetical protein
MLPLTIRSSGRGEKTMPAVSRLMLVLSLVAAIAAGAGGANAASQTPFFSSLTGVVTGTDCAPLTICLSGTDRGTATHLGRAVLTKTATIHITFTPCDDGGVVTTYTEDATLTAANGDTLMLNGGGTACAANGRAIASGELTVTGGTGRFAGATGSLAQTIDHNLVTDAETEQLSGTVSSPGSVH